MIPVQVVSYVVAITYIATFIYLILIWNKNDRK